MRLLCGAPPHPVAPPKRRVAQARNAAIARGEITVEDPREARERKLREAAKAKRVSRLPGLGR